MRIRCILLAVTFFTSLQFIAKANITPESIGFKHLQFLSKSDTVDVLLKLKKGDEQIKKPLLLFCQGSLPKPLIIYGEQGTYGVFPFNTDSLEVYYHLAIVGKPHTPLTANIKTLGRDMIYLDPETGKMSKSYSMDNYLDYYVNRNKTVIDELQKLPYIDNRILIVAGHSEGATVAAKLALESKKVTHLIYASGNPLGRIMTMIAKSRAMESDTTRGAESDFMYWNMVVENKNSLDDTLGDTPKSAYDFSYPPIKYLEQLSIPILVCYGTKDLSAPYNDYLQVEMIRQLKRNFTFKAYIGLEHNFFGVTDAGQTNHEKSNWNSVVGDWVKWIGTQ